MEFVMIMMMTMINIMFWLQIVVGTDHLECKVVDRFVPVCRLHLKCGGTRAETRFRLSAKTDESIYIGEGVSSVDYWQPRYAHQR